MIKHIIQNTPYRTSCLENMEAIIYLYISKKLQCILSNRFLVLWSLAGY